MSAFLKVRVRKGSILNLGRNIDRLIDRIGEATLTEAVRAAGRPMLASAKAKVKKRSGLLHRALKLKVTKKGRGRERSVYGIVGPDKNVTGTDAKGRLTRASKYAHILEFGNKNKSQKPQPYMRPAFDETKDESIRIFAETVKKALPKHADRINRANPL